MIAWNGPLRDIEKLCDGMTALAAACKQNMEGVMGLVSKLSGKDSAAGIRDEP